MSYSSVRTPAGVSFREGLVVWRWYRNHPDYPELEKDIRCDTGPFGALRCYPYKPEPSSSLSRVTARKKLLAESVLTADSTGPAAEQ